jgi:hypothetical protein
MTDLVSALEEPHFPPVTSIFLDWAAQTQDLIAIRQGEHSWTSRDRIDFSGRFAQLLIAWEIRPGNVQRSSDRSASAPLEWNPKGSDPPGESFTYRLLPRRATR